MVSQFKPDTEGTMLKEIDPAKRLINWMSMDDGQTLHFEKFKDSESVADFNETDSDDECDDNYDDDDDIDSQRHEEVDRITETVNADKGYPADHIDGESNVACMESFSDHRSDPAGNVKEKDHENQKISRILAPLSEKSDVKTDGGIKIKETAGYTAPFEVPSSVSKHKSENRKSLKVAFCPKEVKRIIESEALLQKNAQSHTTRKIIVFASLGIRHGCEDMYELDFNHFSVLKKGEPYVSPTNPGVREIRLLVFSLQIMFLVVSRKGISQCKDERNISYHHMIHLFIAVSCHFISSDFQKFSSIVLMHVFVI